MAARKAPQKRGQGRSRTQIAAEVAKEIVDATNSDEISLVNEEPTSIIDVVFAKLPGAILKVTQGGYETKSMKPSSKTSKPHSTTTAKNTQQQKTQRELVVLLRDSSRYGLDDLHRFWQDYVDPVVDWVYETRRKSQPELAAELVSKATRSGKLSELANTVLHRLSTGQQSSYKRGQKR